MPALGAGHALLKWVTSFPGNPLQGLPTVTGVVLLSDAENGQLRAVLDAAAVTALRTGAAAVLAAETLGRADATTAAVIGAGVNGRAAARTFLARGRPVLLWDVNEGRARHVAERARRRGRRRRSRRRSPPTWLVTVTPGHAVLLAEGTLRPGQHVSLMGADGPGKAEAAGAELARAHLFCDDWEQASHGGELAHAVADGLVTEDDVTALGDVLAGTAPGRADAAEITAFDSTGLAIQDLAIALAAVEAAGDLIDLPRLELSCNSPAARRHHLPVEPAGLADEARELELGERGRDLTGREPGAPDELVGGERRVGRRRGRRAAASVSGGGGAGGAGSMPTASSTSAAHVTGVAPSRSSAFVPRESAEVISPGTASTSRPSSSARSAVISAPLRSRASTTTVACASPATMRLRAGKRQGAGSTPGAYSETTSPARGDLGGEGRVGARIVAVDAAAEHRDRRRPPRARRGAPRRRSPRARPEHDHARRRQLAPERRARPPRRTASRRARRRPPPPVARAASSGASPRTKRPGGGSWIDREQRRERRVARARPTGSRVSTGRGDTRPRRRPARTPRTAPCAARRADASPTARRRPPWRARSFGRAPPEGGTRAPRPDARARPRRRRRARRSSRRRARRGPARGPRAAAARPPASGARRPAGVRGGAASRSRPRAASTRSRTRADASARGARQLAGARPRHRQQQVEAVEQRARELLAVALHPLGRARAAGPRRRRALRRGRGSSWRRAGSGPGTPHARRRARPRRSRPRAAGAAPRARAAGTRAPRRGRARRGGRGSPRRAAASRRRRRSARRPRRSGAARETAARARARRPAASTPLTEWIRVTSSAASSASGGRIPGSRRASIVLPVPGGPASSRLWPPAAAISSARRARSCPRTSARSGTSASDSKSSGGRRRLGRVALAAQVGDGLGEVAHADGRDPGERHLGAGLGGADEVREPGAAGALGGDERARRPAAAARRARARRRRRARRAPPSGTWYEAASTASAIGRSKPEPSLRSAAGARLTVMRRFVGHSSSAEEMPDCGRAPSPPGRRGRRGRRSRTPAAPAGDAPRPRRGAGRADERVGDRACEHRPTLGGHALRVCAGQHRK